MPESFANMLRDKLQPMFYADAQNGNALDTYLGSIGDVLFQIVEDWASDTDDGKPGYSILVDASRCPDAGIPWLGQFVGAKISPTFTPAQQRAQLVALSSWKRGTVSSIQTAVESVLTGSQYVQIKERDTSPYHFQVLTYANETPDQNLVLSAINQTKPAGLAYTYVYYSGQKAFALRSGTGSALRGTPPDTLRLVI